MTVPWDGILEDGVKILWQGRPAHMFSMSREEFMIIFSGFEMVWIANTVAAGAWFWFVRLVLKGVGISLTVYATPRDTFARHYSSYSLTSRRAIIGLFYPWAKFHLRKFRITQHMKLIADQENIVPFDPSGKRMRRPLANRARPFTRIDDVGKVFHLMQQIQKETP